MRVAVLGRFDTGRRVRVRRVAGEEHDAGERGGIRGTLDAQVVGPVPGQVDDGGGEQHEEQHRAGEDDGDLAASPVLSVGHARRIEGHLDVGHRAAVSPSG